MFNEQSKTKNKACSCKHHFPSSNPSVFSRKFSILIVLIVSASMAWADTARETVPEYTRYKKSDFLSVDRGTVKAKPFGSRGWHLVIEVPETDAASRVKLTMKGADSIVVQSLQYGRRWNQRGGSVVLRIPTAGWAWFFLHAPLPEMRVENYRPRSVIVSVDTTLRKAKYPVVDVHAHIWNKHVPAAERIEVMDTVGVAVVVDSPMAWAGSTTEDSYDSLEKKYPDRFLTFGTIDFKGRFEEGFPGKAIAKLEEDVKTMNIPGIGETHDKGSGIFGNAFLPEPRGKVHLDDERVMAIWRAAARLKLPILFHVAEPISFYSKLDRNHPFYQWQYRSLHYNLWDTQALSRDEMMRRRDRVMAKIPELVLIGAHMGTLEDDLNRLGDTLDRYPNFHVEIGVRDIYLGLQPHAARRFFIKYQDRILFGQDGAQSVRDYQNHFRLLETDDDQIVFAVNRPAVYGLHLPDEVLRKVYYANSARLMPRVKAALLKQYPNLKFPAD